MSYCSTCGTQKSGNSCRSCKGHVHGSHIPYQNQSSHHHKSHNNDKPVVVHNTLSPAILNKLIEEKAQASLRTNSTGRPILSGIFQANDPLNGAAIPFARVTVTYTGTDSLVALFSDRNKTISISNPAKTSIFGRIPIYYGGGNIDIKVERSCGELVECIENEGGYVDSDFFLEDEQVKDCIDIDNPLLRVYDESNCNLPESMVSPQFVNQWANWKSGLAIGTFSQTLGFFECIGQEFSCGALVFGDTTGVRFRYDCDNCAQNIPPDPETVDFNDDGTSDCWTRLDGFSVCQQELVDAEDLEFLLGCNGEGLNVRAEVSDFQTKISKLDGDQVVFSGLTDHVVFNGQYERQLSSSTVLVMVSFDSLIEAEVALPDLDVAIRNDFTLDIGSGEVDIGEIFINSTTTGGIDTDSVSEQSHISGSAIDESTDLTIDITISSTPNAGQGENLRGQEDNICVTIIEVRS